MSIVTKRPITAGMRGMTSTDLDGITTKKPLKSLLLPKKQRSGRNNAGRITARHRGGGAKRHQRILNYDIKAGTSAIVEHIEYDPNRTARIARIREENGAHHYILATARMRVGQTIACGEDVPIRNGNRLPLGVLPLGAEIHNIALHPNSGGQLIRSAGGSAQLVAKEGAYVQIKLPSGEVRMVDGRCYASLGVIGNDQHQNVKLGSAGRKRRMGRRPKVRGIVMNAVDHPHGGGEGKGKGGNNPQSPWGQPTLGYKTRRRKQTDKFIIKSRHEGNRS